MTLGGMLSLFFVLGMFGVAYLLFILCFDKKLIHENNEIGRGDNNIESANVLISNEKNSLLVPAYNPYWLKGKEPETKLLEPCLKCNKKGINLLTFCKHGYHSACFIPKLGESVECITCKNSWTSVLIYCCSCHKNYIDYRLKPKNNIPLDNMKCQACS